MTQTKEIEWRKLVDEALKLKGSLGKIYNRFYTYSYGNQLLLWCQDVEEPVATYRKWLEMGRQVKKGSKAKMIVRPIPVYDKEKKDDEPMYTIFKPINSVFAYSDTDGDELPEEQIINDWSSTRALEKLGIKLTKFNSTNGNQQGYSENNSIAINPVAVFPLKTTMHELAHITLGHTSNEHTKRSVAEFQAEMVAYCIMNETEAKEGVDWKRGASATYLQQWLNNQQPSESDIKPIFTAVNKILTAGKE